MSGQIAPSVQPFPEPHAPECWTPKCQNPGPYRDVPSLAAHRWASHGIEFADTYGETGYRDQDAPVAAVKPPREETTMSEFVTAPCGKRVRGGPALGGHKGKCLACQAKKSRPESGVPRPAPKMPRPPAGASPKVVKPKPKSARRKNLPTRADSETLLIGRAEALERSAQLLRQAARLLREIA